MATIEKRGDSYLIRISTGYKADGSQVRKNFTWTPAPGISEKQIQKELNKQAVLLEEHAASGRLIDSKMKFSVFADLWMKDYAEKQLSVKTIDRYNDLLQRINDAIGHIRLDRLQPHNLLEFYSNLAEVGIRKDSGYIAAPGLRDKISKKEKSLAKFSRDIGIAASTIKAACDGKQVCPHSAQAIADGLNLPLSTLFTAQDKKTLAAKTVLHHHRLISSILQTAVQWEVIETNPAMRVKAPKVEKTEATYLDEEQALQVIKALDSVSIQHKTMIALLLLTGMRRGEICGLQWDDIDMKDQIISIKRTIQYSPRLGKFEKSPKTLSSVRVIKASDTTISMLKIFKKWQSEVRLRLGDAWQSENRKIAAEKKIRFEAVNWVFTTDTGMPLLPDSVTVKFKKFIVDNGLPAISIKSLRHTSATLMIADGVDIRTVSQRLGHAQASTTMNIYAHAIQSAQAKAAKSLDNKLFPDDKPQTGHKQG